MFYIPKEWLVDVNNDEKVHSILSKLNTDINANINKVIMDLEEINETTVIEKIKDGTITFG